MSAWNAAGVVLDYTRESRPFTSMSVCTVKLKRVGRHAQSNISYDDDYFSPALLNPPSSLV